MEERQMRNTARYDYMYTFIVVLGAILCAANLSNLYARLDTPAWLDICFTTAIFVLWFIYIWNTPCPSCRAKKKLNHPIGE